MLAVVVVAVLERSFPLVHLRSGELSLIQKTWVWIAVNWPDHTVRPQP